MNSIILARVSTREQEEGHSSNVRIANIQIIIDRTLKYVNIEHIALLIQKHRTVQDETYPVPFGAGLRWIDEVRTCFMSNNTTLGAVLVILEYLESSVDK